MGNTQSQVYPELEDESPWVMVTYDPGANYKNFSYHKEYDVCSNNSIKISKIQQPCPPSNPVEYSINSNVICSAVQDINFEDDMTVKELVDSLFEKCEGRENLKDADKVKILFYWLTAQNIKYSEYKLTNDFLTVNYQLQKLSDRKNSYAAFFSLLCYYADIPCVIIRGHVKGGRYEVNKPLTSDLMREWNAVLVDKEWQFVDSLWGRLYHDRFMTREEWYLFPSPDHLKYSHFPENKTWQLVEHPFTEDEFTQLPVLKKRFFEMKMELLSHRKGRVACSTGDLDMKFLLNAKDIDTQDFRCVISKKIEENNEKKWKEEMLPDDGLRLQQLDLIQKTSENDMDDEEDDFNQDDDNTGTSDDNTLHRRESVRTKDFSVLTALSVKVRFKTKGYHKIEIVGRSREDENYDWVALYYVKVDYVPDRAVFFPTMPNIGYGPNPYLRKCGLKAVSHRSGEIKCFTPTELKIKFELLRNAETENVKLRYSLENYLDADDDNLNAQENVIKDNFKPNKDRTILVPVFIEANGEYKLSIAATLNATDKEFVIHYRIVGEVNQAEIKEALVLEILKELEMAIQSKNILHLHTAISTTRSNKVQHHQKVKAKYSQACSLVKQHQRYQNMLQRIGEITSSNILKIKSFQKPEQGIVKIMKTVFLLLGENENDLQNWDMIKALITGIGQKSIKRRMTSLDIKTLKPAVIRRAKQEIGNSNIVDALKKAEDVAAFAVWIKFVLKSYNQDNEPQAGRSSESYV